MPQGEITLPFGNDEYVFNVAKHKQLFELQDKCGLNATGAEGESILIPSGPVEIFNRLRQHRWRECDVVWPIRLGLIGGGLSVSDTNKLMAEFVADQPLGLLAELAARIVFAAAYGVKGDELGKTTAGQAKNEEEKSTSPAPQPSEPAQP